MATNFVHTELSEPIAEFTISIGAFRDNVYMANGTATFVAPFLAITAKHVFEYYWRVLQGVNIKPGHENQIKFNMVGIQIINEGKDCALWDIVQVWFSPVTDIAYFSVSPNNSIAKEYTWKILPTLEMLPPTINTTIACFGFRESSAKLEDGILNWNINPTTSTGLVVDVHHLRRDNFSINFPCIYTDARFDGGMSGGPVFNDEGFLCAIISSNLPPSREGESHVSYAALLWASMNTFINLNREGIYNSGHYPLLELCQGSFIKAKNYERISLFDTDQGKNMGITIAIPRK